MSQEAINTLGQEALSALVRIAIMNGVKGDHIEAIVELGKLHQAFASVAQIYGDMADRDSKNEYWRLARGARSAAALIGNNDIAGAREKLTSLKEGFDAAAKAGDAPDRRIELLKQIAPKAADILKLL